MRLYSSGFWPPNSICESNLQSFLPGFAIVEDASHHDDTRAVALCADLQDGEIASFDKAYVNFTHLSSLTRRGVWWVTRAKDNMAYHVREKLLRKPQGGSCATISSRSRLRKSVSSLPQSSGGWK